MKAPKSGGSREASSVGSTVPSCGRGPDDLLTEVLLDVRPATLCSRNLVVGLNGRFERGRACRVPGLHKHSRSDRAGGFSPHGT